MVLLSGCLLHAQQVWTLMRKNSLLKGHNLASRRQASKVQPPGLQELLSSPVVISLVLFARKSFATVHKLLLLSAAVNAAAAAAICRYN